MGTGCSGETNANPTASFSDLYDLTKNSNQTYSYTFSDLYGNILYQRENAVRELLGEYRTIPAFSELWNRFVGNEEQPVRRLLLGHSHNCYTLQAAKNEMYINPGSIHYRLGPNCRTTGADYITVTDGVPTLKHVDYPTAHLRKLLEQSNFRDDVKRTATYFNQSVVD
jgi:hypothetical protein